MGVTQRRRILWVVGQLDVGGTERHIGAIAPALRTRGWEIEVFAFRSGPLREVLIAGGVPVHLGWDVSGSASWLAKASGLATISRRLATLVAAGDYAIVQFFLPEAFLVGSLTLGGRYKGVRILARRSLRRYRRRRPLLSVAERVLRTRADLALGNSVAVGKELLEEGFEDRKVGVVHNGVPLDGLGAARAEARRRLGIGDEETVLVVVANLLPYKGHVDLLRAFAGLRLGPGRKVRLLLAGEDRGSGQVIRRLAEQLGVAGSVTLLGKVAKIGDVLGCADIGVLASHEEGFSNAVLEYMGAGLPVVATQVGGNPEAVVHGVSGLLVPARAPGALRDALQRLVDEPELRARMGRAGRQRVAKAFSIEQCAAKYENLYAALDDRHASIPDALRVGAVAKQME